MPKTRIATLFSLFISSLLLLIIIILKADQSKDTRSRAASLDNFQTGGTNYTIYDAGDGVDNTNLTIESSTSLKSVVGSYDLNPNLVRNQLQSMCNSGQKKISLIIWFFPFLPEWGMQHDAVYIQHRLPHINSIEGKLTQRHEQNLTAVLGHIKNLKNSQNGQCFNELQFRFAPMGIAQPIGWTAWNETRYQETWNLIYHTHNLIKSVIGSSPIALYFDLGAEQGGRDEGQNTAYIKRLLADYNFTFGKNDTYGFSIAWAPGRFQHLIATYNQVGIRPDSHAIDIYDEGNQGLGSQLTSLYNEMTQSGENNKPILIQETYYNDPTAFSQIIQSINTLGIKIRGIMQWQMERNNLNTWKIGSSYIYSLTPSPTLFLSPTTLPPTITPTKTPTRTPTPSLIITETITPTKTPVVSPTPSFTPSPTRTPTPSFILNASPTRTPSPTSLVTITPTLPIRKPGDATGDGKVDGLDYVIWLNNYNKQTMGSANGDFNNNGKVDGLDYIIWLNNYGK